MSSYTTAVAVSWDPTECPLIKSNTPTIFLLCGGQNTKFASGANSSTAIMVINYAQTTTNK
jgi:hypothetical protein